MMQVKVIYFGQVAERLGMGSESLTLDSGAVIDLRAHLVARHPALATLSWKLAVDQEFVDGPCSLRENAEIVVLPPFAGG